MYKRQHSQYIVIDCQLDLDDWRERFWREYRKEDTSLSELLNDIKPYNWSISDAGKYVQRYTIEASEGHPVENVNSEDLLNKALGLWGVVGNFDVLNKILYVVNPQEYTATGEYITEELNLKSLGYTGTSTNFATRLYAYGKTDDKTKIPLSISSVNDGKEYVENHRYSDRIISVGWKDEQYTDAQTLKNAAINKLEKLSFPERSYECEVNNLDQDIWLYKVVTLIDRKRHTRVNHQVVEYKEYPKRHSLDVVTLSTLPPTIEGTYNQIRTEITEQVEQTKTTMEIAIEDATRLITGQDGGYVVLDPAERPERILMMDQPDKDVYKRQGADSMKKVSDQMFAAQSIGKMTFDELSYSISQLSPISAQAGMQTEELMTCLALLTGNGMSANEAVGNLGNVLNKLLNPSAEVSTAAEQLGIDFSASALQSKGFSGVLDAVKEAMLKAAPEYINLSEKIETNKIKLQELTEQGRSNTEEYKNLTTETQNMQAEMDALAQVSDSPISKVAALFGTTKQLNSMLSFTSESGSKSFQDALSKIKSSAGETQKAFDQMASSPLGKMESDFNKLKIAGMHAGEALLPIATELVEGIGKLAESFSKLEPEEQKLIAAAGGIEMCIRYSHYPVKLNYKKISGKRKHQQ